MGEMFLCFRCCIAEQTQPKRRRRIDRSMIGLPTDFKHTGHIGSGDMSAGTSCASGAQTQMSSKGGYSQVSPVNVHLNLIDVQRAES